MSEDSQIKCNCGLPVGRRTSWTERNPGRRFMSCKFYEPESEWRGCNFFKWVDEDMTEWQRHLSNKLILEKKLLELQLTTSQAEVKELESQRNLLLTDNCNLKLKCKALNAELKLRMKKDASKRVGSSMVVGLSSYYKVVYVCFFVLLLVVVVMSLS